MDVGVFGKAVVVRVAVGGEGNAVQNWDPVTPQNLWEVLSRRGTLELKARNIAVDGSLSGDKADACVMEGKDPSCQGCGFISAVPHRDTFCGGPCRWPSLTRPLQRSIALSFYRLPSKPLRGSLVLEDPHGDRQEAAGDERVVHPGGNVRWKHLGGSGGVCTCCLSSPSHGRWRVEGGQIPSILGGSC
ncbi:hypothetical protein DPEC_G00359010 [Dallia pectoralis]|uniref:Uncharacterized protein n=1 Tax=Dallia pectoralis TaxID=75939 RepID=A0ACC2F0E8_DALPE|nr:hypothetical protein DPEC_G00359010 [Dallia pectoralis]